MTINPPGDPTHTFIHTIMAILRELYDNNGITPRQLASIFVRPIAGNHGFPLHGNIAITAAIMDLAGTIPEKNPEPPPAQQAPGINPNMYATPHAQRTTLPTRINIDNLATNTGCRSYNIPLSHSSVTALCKHWNNRNRMLTLPADFPQGPLTASPPVLAAAKAIWLLNASTDTIATCLTDNAIPIYATEHQQMPTSYTYPNIDAALPHGFRCDHKGLTINQLLHPFTHEPEDTYHGLPWYTYPIVAELTVPARKGESTAACKHLTGYAIFHNQCQAIISVNNHPSYTLIGNRLREELNLSLLACKIFPINKNRNNNNTGKLRILTTFVVIPTPNAHHNTVGNSG